jgi:hypothetical protein
MTLLNNHPAQWHPAHEDDEHPPQLLLEEPEDDPVDDLPMPKRDIIFSVLVDPHFSHFTSGFDPYTSFSNSALHALQRYS